MNLFLKRVFDIVFSLILIIVLLPLFIIISIAIKIDSCGPIFFKQNRITRNGKIFKILKFRSMVVNAEKIGCGLYNFEGDKRVTKVGKFLRKTSLDELPQVFNVLMGHMSIVGPRPSVINEIGEYNDLNEKYRRRFKMRGGITGLAQINGRNELSWSNKIEFDNKYISLFEKYGVLIDIKIMVLTALRVFKTKNIYEIRSVEHLGLSDEDIAKIEAKRLIEESTKKEGI